MSKYCDDLQLCESMKNAKPWRATSVNDTMAKWADVAVSLIKLAAWPATTDAATCKARWEQLQARSSDPLFGDSVSPELQSIVQELLQEIEKDAIANNQPNAKLVLGGAAVAGAVAAPVATTAVVAGLGFTSGGIVAGSTAAGMMSAAAVANGGGVAAGSTVAVLQSIGAAGLGVGGGIAVAAIGVAIAVPIAGAFLWFRKRRNNNNNDNNNDDNDDGSNK
ncbi:hypothetical protein SPRG_13703 [Saprolegnia parasitica CBS 223.65]|uniref:Uncharacterized protein n=1 Tax=Saprolegnia parasitica (strain CBS 223.65) TaxID=695850 RepID=A0A067BX17_SAPPC|nr:hypothetical protein SPRG_13703 [Saprolegnia parasitica CBS 223.65]KDO21390.1 hypothetical protein SPRG_13703 [Saprolegnia parasitica CBS 223.65]|eukprot:XP_012207945.1 hypothetical protein SPRG_13703 [Saprolegnia parasitica CBS 223.65]